MLVLTRKPGEQIIIADNIRITVVALGHGRVKIGIEAAIGQGWFEAFGLDAFIGMTEFGASAPAKDVYAHFGITAEAIVETAKALL